MRITPRSEMSTAVRWLFLNSTEFARWMLIILSSAVTASALTVKVVRPLRIVLVAGDIEHYVIQ